MTGRNNSIEIQNHHRPFLALIVLVLSFQLSYGQQRAEFTRYMFAPVSLNPAYAGTVESTDVLLMARSQWIGIDGAPETQMLSITSPLKNNLGVGGTIIADKIGPVNQYLVLGSLSYEVKVTETSKLSFGLNLGANLFNADWSKGRFQNPDVLFNENINGRFLAHIGAGLYYYTDNWYAGVSIPNFLQSDYYDPTVESIAQEEYTYYMMAGRVFQASEDIRLKAAILGRITKGVPYEVDISMTGYFGDTFSLGISHRYGDAISALAGVQVSNQFFFGYSYDTTTSDLRFYNGGSHEVILRYSIFKGETRQRRLF